MRSTICCLPTRQAALSPEHHQYFLTNYVKIYLSSIKRCNFAQTMIYKGQQPVVKFIDKVYLTGVALTQKEMVNLERRFDRLQDLSKWFVHIAPMNPGD